MKWADTIVVIIFFIIGLILLYQLYPRTLGEIQPTVYKISYSTFNSLKVMLRSFVEKIIWGK